MNFLKKAILTLLTAASIASGTLKATESVSMHPSQGSVQSSTVYSNESKLVSIISELSKDTTLDTVADSAYFKVALEQGLIKDRTLTAFNAFKKAHDIKLQLLSQFAKNPTRETALAIINAQKISARELSSVVSQINQELTSLGNSQLLKDLGKAALKTAIVYTASGKKESSGKIQFSPGRGAAAIVATEGADYMLSKNNPDKSWQGNLAAQGRGVVARISQTSVKAMSAEHIVFAMK